jgi:serine protease
MRPQSSIWWARAGLTLLACATLLVLPGRGQMGRPAVRSVVQSTGLPGVDRGLREHDRPIEPSTRGSRGVRARMMRSDGTRNDRAFLTGSIIVKFRTGASGTAVNSAMRVATASAIERPPYANFDILQIPPDADPETVAAELRLNPDVEYAQPRYRNYPMSRPNDPLYNRQWNFPALDMERAWDIQPQAGSDIVVAVLDTGVAFRTTTLRYTADSFYLTEGGPEFPALGQVDVPFAVAPELGDAKFVDPFDFIWDDDLPVDLDGHGTHVSGTIGQLTNNGIGVAGMAYNVRIMPVKVIDDVWDFIFNSPFIGTDDTLARGIRYAADNGAKVINMSIGRSEGGPATVTDDAIRYAISRGAFVVVAAGNTADSGNAPSRTAQSAREISGMVAVSAVGRALERAYYSTTNRYVELAAPGGDQRRDGGDGGILQQTLDLDLLHTYELGPESFSAPRADMFAYYYFQGTSMATSHVSALAALLMQQGITNPAAIESAMKQFARDLGPAGVDNQYGDGLIQPRATLRGMGLAR